MEQKSRVDWIDIMRAIAILLVALYHSVVLGVPEGFADPIWGKVNGVLAGFRMPIFFFATGLFAESIIGRSWTRLWSSRLALLVWMFILWTALRFAYFTAVPMASRHGEADPIVLLLSPVWPTTGLWFLHALVIFFVVSKLIRRFSALIVVSIATVLSVLFFGILSTGNLSYDGMAQYFVFFLLGLHLRELVLHFNERPRPL
ncbi:acyltransferase family protein, partial [Microbacterium profundi]